MWSDDGGTIIYHGGYADGPAMVGKYDLATARRWEIALPDEYTAYGHFTMDHDQNLCCDGYFRFPGDERIVRENSTDNGPTPTRKTASTSPASFPIGKKAAWSGSPCASTAAIGWGRTPIPIPCTTTRGTPSTSTAGTAGM